MKRLKKYQGILGGSSVGSDGGTYKVKKGDTFFGIANRFKVDWNDLISSNPDLDEKARNKLVPGQSILVPGLKTQSSVLDLPTMYDFLDQAGVVYEPPSRQTSNSLLDAAAKAAKNKAKGTKINKVIEAKKKKRDDDAAVFAAWKDDLKINENSVRKGFKGGRFNIYDSLEGGRGTIGYGHKETKKEHRDKTFAGGISEKQADILLDKDMAIHLNAFRNEFNEMFGPGSYDKLSLDEKIVGADYHFNGLQVKDFEKFFTAMHQGDVDRMKKEHVRSYTDDATGKLLPLKQRNTWTRKKLGWEKQDGGIVSEYGWDYKKDGDNYLTRRTGNEDWITARGNALDAIKSKIFNEGPQMSQEEAEVSQRQEWMDRVRRYINRGMTLDDLAPLMGTRQGILQYFPELANEAVNQNVDAVDDEGLSVELNLYDAGEISFDDLSSEAIEIVAEKERKAWRKEKEKTKYPKQSNIFADNSPFAFTKMAADFKPRGLNLDSPAIRKSYDSSKSFEENWKDQFKPRGLQFDLRSEEEKERSRLIEEEVQKEMDLIEQRQEESVPTEESIEVDDEGTSIELDLYRSGEISIDDLSPEAFDIIAEEERKDYRSNREKKIEEVVESPWRDNLRQEYLKSNEELFTQGNPFDQAPAENEADDYYQNLFQRLKDIDQQESINQWNQEQEDKLYGSTHSVLGGRGAKPNQHTRILRDNRTFAEIEADRKQQELRDAETANYKTVTQSFMQENFPITSSIIDGVSDAAGYVADEVEDVVDKIQKTSILPGYITNDAEALYNFGSSIVNKDYEALLDNKYGQKLALKILDQNENPNKYMGLRFKTLTGEEMQQLRRGLEKVGALTTPMADAGAFQKLSTSALKPKPDNIFKINHVYKDKYHESDNKSRNRNREELINDNIFSYTSQWDNDEGFEYIVSPTKKYRKPTDEYAGVEGVGHFMLDASIDTRYPHVHNNNYGFLSKAIDNNDWIPTFTRGEGNKVILKYKKPSDIEEDTKRFIKEQYNKIKHLDANKDERKRQRIVEPYTKELYNREQLVLTPLRQYKFSDIDFNENNAKDIKGFDPTRIKAMSIKDGGQTHLVYHIDAGLEKVGRFDGGSVVFIFEDKYGNTIVRDFSGAIDHIRKAGEEIIKTYDLKPDELTIGYHDIGSFSAKPMADSNKVLKANQWQPYNKYGEVTGSALMIPAK